MASTQSLANAGAKASTVTSLDTSYANSSIVTYTNKSNEIFSKTGLEFETNTVQGGLNQVFYPNTYNIGSNQCVYTFNNPVGTEIESYTLLLPINFSVLYNNAATRVSPNWVAPTQQQFSNFINTIGSSFDQDDFFNHNCDFYGLLKLFTLTSFSMGTTNNLIQTMGTDRGTGIFGNAFVPMDDEDDVREGYRKFHIPGYSMNDLNYPPPNNAAGGYTPNFVSGASYSTLQTAGIASEWASMPKIRISRNNTPEHIHFLKNYLKAHLLELQQVNSRTANPTDQITNPANIPLAIPLKWLIPIFNQRKGKCFPPNLPIKLELQGQSIPQLMMHFGNYIIVATNLLNQNVQLHYQFKISTADTNNEIGRSLSMNPQLYNAFTWNQIPTSYVQLGAGQTQFTLQVTNAQAKPCFIVFFPVLTNPVSDYYYTTEGSYLFGTNFIYPNVVLLSMTVVVNGVDRQFYNNRLDFGIGNINKPQWDLWNRFEEKAFPGLCKPYFFPSTEGGAEPWYLNLTANGENFYDTIKDCFVMESYNGPENLQFTITISEIVYANPNIRQVTQTPLTNNLTLKAFAYYNTQVIIDPSLQARVNSYPNIVTNLTSGSINLAASQPFNNSVLPTLSGTYGAGAQVL